MRKTKQDYTEARWRAKVTVGLFLIFAWVGAWLFVLHGFHWRVPELPQIWAARGLIFFNPYFYIVAGLCGGLGLWLAWLFFSNRRAADEPEQNSAGMSAPKF